MNPLVLNPVPGLTFLSEENGKPCHKHLLDGVEIPGCTSISGLFQDDGWKFAWPPKLMAETIHAELNQHSGTDADVYVEIKRRSLNEIISKAKNAWRKKRDKAADTGTIAHGYIEDYIKHGVKAPPTAHTEVLNCFYEFLKWETAYQPEWLLSEVQVGSRVHRYGGILDALANIGGLLTLVDFKTSKDIKDDYAIQLAGLTLALEEMGVRVDCRAILHLPKEGEYEYRIIDSDLKKDQEAFLAGLGFYRQKNLFAARCAKQKEQGQ